MKETKFDRLIEVLESNNSNTESHREQHKCLWNKTNTNTNDIKILQDELHSNTPGREGLFLQIKSVKDDMTEGFINLKDELNDFRNELKEINERNLKKDTIKTFLISILSFIGSGGVFYIINFILGR